MQGNGTGRHRRVLLGVNGLKAVIALVFIARPSAIEAWVGQTAHDPGGGVLLRAFGVRDLALAVGALRATDPVDRRRWLVAGGACDLVDAAVTIAAARRSPERMGAMATMTSAWAGASGVACLALAATERPGRLRESNRLPTSEGP